MAIVARGPLGWDFESSAHRTQGCVCFARIGIGNRQSMIPTMVMIETHQ